MCPPASANSSEFRGRTERSPLPFVENLAPPPIQNAQNLEYMHKSGSNSGCQITKTVLHPGLRPRSPFCLALLNPLKLRRLFQNRGSVIARPGQSSLSSLYQLQQSKCTDKDIMVLGVASMYQQVVKVIWQQAASSPHMDGSMVFTRLRQCAPPSNTCFLGPARVQIPNGISISSAVFGGLTTVTERQTDRPTDHATWSVTSGHIYVRTAMRPIVKGQRDETNTRQLAQRVTSRMQWFVRCQRYQSITRITDGSN